MSLLRFARMTTAPLAKRMMCNTMATGTVKWFNITKGYGFITRNDEAEGQEVFVHQTQIKSDGFRFLKEGEDVEFDLVNSDRGIQASNVTGPDGIPLDRSFRVDEEL